jgi:hypothetical protein
MDFPIARAGCVTAMLSRGITEAISVLICLFSILAGVFWIMSASVKLPSPMEQPWIGEGPFSLAVAKHLAGMRERHGVRLSLPGSKLQTFSSNPFGQRFTASVSFLP